MPHALRRLSLVRLKKSVAGDQTARKLPFIEDQPLIYFGEIPNMPEHGVFGGSKSGRIYSGYHVEQFEEVPKDET